ncbi:hypothetical protein [Streptomyces sp. DH37]|uniref:hypothetical protein n=1 Tax=Streptomyces sp. DH37 TaxID=3040122 RepID=UPI002442FCED|nr:hypothetical protein [Streptomyces sp. DH37]MDG9705526.1 hypothetical protein [Streptomyces sp. DH37]
MSAAFSWAAAHPLPATAAVLLALALAAVAVWLLVRVGRRAARRVPAAVLAASLAAVACTAYSADTSWRFATHSLGMVSTAERAAMFAAAELALFAVALMARQNLRTTGAPGTPGVLVWVITGVQIIPAYAESGFVGGTVRAVVGPVLAALLWHLAMGIELRHAKPGAGSESLPAVLAREIRERLLSRLGLAVRDRSAEEITRDRATVRAVALAAKLADMGPDARGRARVARRLSVAVGKAQAGADPERRRMLLELLAARRHAASLAVIDLPSPWQPGERAEVTTEVTVERVNAEPGENRAGVVMSPLPVLEFRPIVWPPEMTIKERPEVTAAVPAEAPREVVTEVVTLTPAELRKRARALNREVVRSTGRPVTIARLREEYGLSRREATELRREVVGEERS